MRITNNILVAIPTTFPDRSDVSLSVGIELENIGTPDNQRTEWLVFKLRNECDYTDELAYPADADIVYSLRKNLSLPDNTTGSQAITSMTALPTFVGTLEYIHHSLLASLLTLLGIYIRGRFA